MLPLERLGAAIEVLLCSGFPTQLLLIVIMNALGMRAMTAGGNLSPTYIFTLSLLDTALVLGLVFFFLHAHREPPRRVLFGTRPVLREALLGILLMPIMLVVVAIVLAIILTLAPRLHDVPRNPLHDMLQNRSDAIVFAVVVMIAGGVREEAQRGFILWRFEQYLGGGLLGIVLFSAAFALGHLNQGTDLALATGFLGAIWGAVYLVRRSIVAPMVSHATFNLVQILRFAPPG